MAWYSNIWLWILVLGVIITIIGLIAAILYSTANNRVVPAWAWFVVVVGLVLIGIALIVTLFFFPRAASPQPPPVPVVVKQVPPPPQQQVYVQPQPQLLCQWLQDRGKRIVYATRVQVQR